MAVSSRQNRINVPNYTKKYGMKVFNFFRFLLCVQYLIFLSTICVDKQDGGYMVTKLLGYLYKKLQIHKNMEKKLAFFSDMGFIFNILIFSFSHMC